MVKKLSRSKLEVLKKFADLGGKKPRTVLKQEIRAQVKIADLDQILRLISPKKAPRNQYARMSLISFLMFIFT